MALAIVQIELRPGGLGLVFNDGTSTQATYEVIPKYILGIFSQMQMSGLSPQQSVVLRDFNANNIGISVSAYDPRFGWAKPPLLHIVEDPSPQLGGELDLNGFGIFDSTGGANSRGVGAMDLQLQRAAVNQVASGNYSFIAGGRNNIAAGLFSFAAGTGVIVTGEAAHGHGDQTTSNDEFSHSEGSQTVAVFASSHAEGQNTRAELGRSFTSGYDTKSGSRCHAQGYGSEAHGSASVARGFGNRAGADVVNSDYVLARGIQAESSFYGTEVHASGQFALRGDAQVEKVELRRHAVQNEWTPVYADGSSQLIRINNDEVHACRITIAAKRSDSSEGAMFKRMVLVSSSGNVAVIQGEETIGTDIITGSTTYGDYDVRFSIDVLNNLLIEVKHNDGAGPKEVTWSVSVASVHIKSSVTTSGSISLSPSPSISYSPSTSYTPSISVSPSISISHSPSISLSPSVSLSPSPSISYSPSTSRSPSISISASPSLSPSPSHSILSASPNICACVGMGDVLLVSSNWANSDCANCADLNDSFTLTKTSAIYDEVQGGWLCRWDDNGSIPDSCGETDGAQVILYYTEWAGLMQLFWEFPGLTNQAQYAVSLTCEELSDVVTLDLIGFVGTECLYPDDLDIMLTSPSPSPSLSILSASHSVLSASISLSPSISISHSPSISMSPSISLSPSTMIGVGDAVLDVNGAINDDDCPFCSAALNATWGMTYQGQNGDGDYWWDSGPIGDTTTCLGTDWSFRAIFDEDFYSGGVGLLRIYLLHESTTETYPDIVESASVWWTANRKSWVEIFGGVWASWVANEDHSPGSTCEGDTTGLVFFNLQEPSPSISPSLSMSPSLSISHSPSISISPSLSPSPSISAFSTSPSPSPGPCCDWTHFDVTFIGDIGTSTFCCKRLVDSPPLVFRVPYHHMDGDYCVFEMSTPATGGCLGGPGGPFTPPDWRIEIYWNPNWTATHNYLAVVLYSIGWTITSPIVQAVSYPPKSDFPPKTRFICSDAENWSDATQYWDSFHVYTVGQGNGCASFDGWDVTDILLEANAL